MEEDKQGILCHTCGFRFPEVYAVLGRDLETDEHLMMTVCPNCHSALDEGVCVKMKEENNDS